MNGNNRRCRPHGRKGIQRPRKIENISGKIHATARKVLYHGIGNFDWASGSGRGEVSGSRKKIQWGRRESKRKNETPQGMWLGEARKG